MYLFFASSDSEGDTRKDDSIMMISSARIINGNNQTSDSNDIDVNFHPAKRAKHKENNDYNTTLHKFKGVVPQQNGHWGAQIYANHQRIWLGTFKTEREAAMAYDSATIKLRSGESHRNFPWNDQTVQEPHFQSHYSTEAVLSMIRDGTYPSKFASFIQTQIQQGEEAIIGATYLKQTRLNYNNGEENKFACTQLFQKELTPSDVGKLNRLVIPKKHASRYFPYVEEENNINGMDHNGDTELVFYDKLMRSWKFRYCYWRSSQSFVFTRGWNRFVKDKNLRAKDIIAFYKCEPVARAKGGEVFSLIDVIYHNEDHEKMPCFGERKRDFEQSLGKMLSFNNGLEDEDGGDNDETNEAKDRKELSSLHSTHNAEKGLRLFGIRIN